MGILWEKHGRKIELVVHLLRCGETEIFAQVVRVRFEVVDDERESGEVRH